MSNLEKAIKLLNNELFPELSNISRICGILRQDIYRNTQRGKNKKKTQGGSNSKGDPKSLEERVKIAVNTTLKQGKTKTKNTSLNKNSKFQQATRDWVTREWATGIRNRKRTSRKSSPSPKRSKTPSRSKRSKTPSIIEIPINPVHKEMKIFTEKCQEHISNEEERIGQQQQLFAPREEKKVKETDTLALRVAEETRSQTKTISNMLVTLMESAEETKESQEEIKEGIIGVGHQVEKAKDELYNKLENMSDQLRGVENCKEEYIQSYVQKIRKSKRDFLNTLEYKSDNIDLEKIRLDYERRKKLSKEELKKENNENMRKYAEEIRSKKEMVITAEIEGKGEVELPVRKALQIKKGLHDEGVGDISDIPWYQKLYFNFMCWMTIIKSGVYFIGSCIQWFLSIVKALLFVVPHFIASPFNIIPCLGAYLYAIVFALILFVEVLVIYSFGGGSLIRGPMKVAARGVEIIMNIIIKCMGLFKASWEEFKGDVQVIFKDVWETGIYPVIQAVGTFLYCCLPDGTRRTWEGRPFGADTICGNSGALKKNKSKKKHKGKRRRNKKVTKEKNKDSRKKRR